MAMLTIILVQQCIICFHFESTLAAVLAYFTLVIILTGILKNLVNHAEEVEKKEKAKPL